MRSGPDSPSSNSSMAQFMSKIFADVREYQDQARAAGFYHTTNLVLSYLHVTDTCKQAF